MAINNALPPEAACAVTYFQFRNDLLLLHLYNPCCLCALFTSQFALAKKQNANLLTVSRTAGVTFRNLWTVKFGKFWQQLRDILYLALSVSDYLYYHHISFQTICVIKLQTCQKITIIWSSWAPNFTGKGLQILGMHFEIMWKSLVSYVRWALRIVDNKRINKQIIVRPVTIDVWSN